MFGLHNIYLNFPVELLTVVQCKSKNWNTEGIRLQKKASGYKRHCVLEVTVSQNMMLCSLVDRYQSYGDHFSFIFWQKCKTSSLLTEINNMQYLLTCIDHIFKEQIICISVAREVQIRGLVNVLVTHTFTKCGWHSSGQHSCFVGPGVSSLSKVLLSWLWCFMVFIVLCRQMSWYT